MSEFGELSFSILRLAARSMSRDEFLRQALELIVDFSGVDKAELRFEDEHRNYRAELSYISGNPFMMTVRPLMNKGASLSEADDDNEYERLCAEVSGGANSSGEFVSKPKDSILFADISRAFQLYPGHPRLYTIKSPFRSLGMYRLKSRGDRSGLLVLWSNQPDHIKEAETAFYESIAQSIGIALGNYQVQEALRERVKELTCLYNIDRIFEKYPTDLNAALDAIVRLLPSAWLHAEIAQACIVLDGIEHATEGYRDSPHRQSTEIVLGGSVTGRIDVVYTEQRPVLDEGPFLHEERQLLEMIAYQIGLVLQNKKTEEERLQLEAQLRHADRLATIGQLAAGVAHELNEPLANVLGFAQLAQKDSALPRHLAKDVARIVEAALHAREVVSKLMLFARQKLPARGRVNLNQLVDGGLYLLGGRCAKANIELVRHLDPALPEIDADAGQLHQVLVNLAVNAMQAMPKGGKLTVRTTLNDEYATLSVEDTGSGMSGEVLCQIFTPFFTTKGVGEGTGLGLSVVHGIVTGHGGSIDVWSEVGRGSRFAVNLPVRKPREPHSEGNDDTQK